MPLLHPTTLPELQNDTVLIWQIPLQAALPMQEYRAVLVDDEIARADQFRFDIHRERWTVCRAAARMILRTYLPTMQHTLELAYGDNGKPYLKNYPDLHFNISHSRDMALLGICRAGAIGVDIERTDRNIDHLRLSRRFFAPSEQEALAEVTLEERSDIFFKIWSRKEAYIKCSGQGLRIPLSSFAVNTSTTHPSILRHNAEVSTDRWKLYHIDVGEDFRAACISSVPTVKILLQQFSTEAFYTS